MAARPTGLAEVLRNLHPTLLLVLLSQLHLHAAALSIPLYQGGSALNSVHAHVPAVYGGFLPSPFPPNKSACAH